MYRDKFLTFLLLLSISFSIAHGFVYAVYDDEHVGVLEYIQELSVPSDHGDICDVHAEFHTSDLLLDKVTYLDSITQYTFFSTHTDIFSSEELSSFFKPPIL